ncbi:potassium channel protein [Saliterribacillus persicus]|uniref:Voltage-gated potassium channel n=1 Tax=Saliterribacillus persicus TaxID=930114 RepID=A0A368X8T9_9BACI|nr:potassium channel family protein [Saliterribacillus persicus]RCW62847.1 voltage-gated potassium channel [Saliterribacillus persicus]
MQFFLKLGLNLIKMRNLTLILSTGIFILLCTVIIYTLEPETFESLLNSFYFVMTTFSTVGYGDYSPVTMTGKLFAVVMYLIGIGLLGVVIGKIVDAFSIFKRKKEEGKLNYLKKNHIIIVGWSKKTEAAIDEIVSTNQNVGIVIIDTLPHSPIDVGDEQLHYIQGDPNEEETFLRANIEHAASVIIFADNTLPDAGLKDAKTLALSIIIERLAPHVHTTVEILVEKNTANFAHVKVDEYILSENTISRLAVRSSIYKGVSKIYRQLISRQHGEDLYQITSKKNWVTYRDAFDELLESGATLIADGEKLDINRRLEEQIPENAELYVICDHETYQSIM